MWDSYLKVYECLLWPLWMHYELVGDFAKCHGFTITVHLEFPEWSRSSLFSSPPKPPLSAPAMLCCLTSSCFVLPERESGATRIQQVKPSKSSKSTWRTSRVRPAPPQAPREDSKGRRHPFVLYGSGEKDADMARRKTHNVGPIASTKEVICLSTVVYVCVVTNCAVSEQKHHQELSLTFTLLSDPRVSSTRQDQAGGGATNPDPESWAPESKVCWCGQEQNKARTTGVQSLAHRVHALLLCSVPIGHTNVRTIILSCVIECVKLHQIL